MITLRPLPAQALLVLRSLLAPATCELCDVWLGEVNSLCGECESTLFPLSESRCEICALPFEGGLSPHCCSDCLRETPKFRKATSVFEFEGSLIPLLHRLKFGGESRLLASLISRAAPCFRKVLQEFAPDRLLPVPLPWWRRLRRGFNQSTAIAMVLQRAVGSRIPFLTGVHRRATSPQALKTRVERLRALRGVFFLKRTGSLRGRRILIVDDVLTTGATAEALSKTLLHAGAEVVQVFTLARVRRYHSARSSRLDSRARN